MDSKPATLPRHAPCPCGSGKRFKHCCGATSEAGALSFLTLKHSAVAAHREGHLLAALSGYERALDQHADDPELRHMHAVALWQLGCHDEAAHEILALALSAEDSPEHLWHNVGLIAFARPPEDGHAAARAAQRAAWQREIHDRLSRVRTPSVDFAVVIASHNHARYIGGALASVAEQTYAPREVVIIDDGSTDGSVEAIHAALAEMGHRFRIQFHARENRGAAATWNEAIRLTEAPWIVPLNSDDAFAPDRLATLAAAIDAAAGTTEFLFGAVDPIDAAGEPISDLDLHRHARLRAATGQCWMHPAVGLALLVANPTLSTGNQCFSRALWQRLGGYRELRYNHDWDFALRASRHCEPLSVPGARYRYRMHASNTILESDARAREEALRLRTDFLADTGSAPANPFAPTFEHWGEAFMTAIAAGGLLGVLPPPIRRAWLRRRLDDLQAIASRHLAMEH